MDAGNIGDGGHTSDFAPSFCGNPFLGELANLLPDYAMVMPLIAGARYELSALISGGASLEHSLRATVNEVLLDKGALGRLIQLEDGDWLVLFQSDLRCDRPAPLVDPDEFDWSALESRCDTLRARFRSQWRCSVSFAAGRITRFKHIAGEYELLRAKPRGECIHMPSCGDHPSTGKTRSILWPNYQEWSSLLRNSQGRVLISEITSYLAHSGESARSSSMFLCSLQQDILQIVYVVLSERGIEAHRLEIENEEMAISRNACRSAKDMASWLNFIVNKADALLADTRDDEGTLVEKVKNVVIKGLDEKLSRKAIAERLQVNPDYLGKIFKREMGISINAYVQNERMKQARILLAKTDMPIYTIALEVGFDNFSHFSESFRKATGTCPGIYRKERTRVSIE